MQVLGVDPTPLHQSPRVAARAHSTAADDFWRPRRLQVCTQHSIIRDLNELRTEFPPFILERRLGILLCHRPSLTFAMSTHQTSPELDHRVTVGTFRRDKLKVQETVWRLTTGAGELVEFLFGSVDEPSGANLGTHLKTEEPCSVKACGASRKPPTSIRPLEHRFVWPT